MKKVVIPPELNEEFLGLKFIPYGDMMVKIAYNRDYHGHMPDPVDEYHKAAARLMEYNYPNLIALEPSWLSWNGLWCTLVFVDPELFKPQSQPEWDGTCGPK